jgi:hypothetical protein
VPRARFEQLVPEYRVTIARWHVVDPATRITRELPAHILVPHVADQPLSDAALNASFACIRRNHRPSAVGYWASNN